LVMLAARTLAEKRAERRPLKRQQ